MRGLVVFALALVASASANLVDIQTGYHKTVGIPAAKRIKENEEKIISESALDERIVGGAVAPSNAHPYFAGLLISLLGVSGNSVCGSSLLSGNRMVTAAHCWFDGWNQAWQFEAILGSNYLFFGGTRIATTSVVMHPQYTPHNLNNDIAMIYLPTSVWFTNSIQPINIPTSTDLWNSFVGNWAVAAGFGRTSDLVFALALVASASANLVDIQTGYHEAVGIPAAKRIKENEEKVISESALDERIVGGAVAPSNAHPYFAGLLISLLGVSGNSVCGSSLLSGNRMVTAAHCWFDGWNQAWQFEAILGSNYLFFGGTRIATTSVVMHPQYTPHNLNNDIAMIYLPTSVWFTNSIQPINIPTSTDLWNSFVGNWAVAAGFGRTSDQQAGASTIVSHVNLQVISVPQCQAVFGSNFVVSSTICTSGVGGVGICGGDSGGPLVRNHNGQPTLIGISSFVAQNACQQGFPSAFARVTSFSSFITQHM